MANKYYVQRQQQSPILAAGDILYRFQGLRQQGELARGQQDIERQRLGLMKRQTETEYGPEGTTGQGLASRRVTADERLNDIRQGQLDIAQKEVPIPKQNFGLDKVAMFEGALKQSGMDKAFSPILDSMKDMAKNPKFNNLEVYTHYKANWPVYKQAVLESLQKEAVATMATNPARAEQITKIMQQIEADNDGTLIDQAMPATAMSVSNQQAEVSGKLSTQPYETWETPDGKTINLRRGEMPPDGAVKYDPGRQEVIESDGQGGFRIIRGSKAGEEPALSRRGQGTLEENLIAAQDAAARLDRIRESYSADYLRIDKRLDFLKTGWQQKLAGTAAEKILGKAKPEEIEKARKYWKFRQDSVANLNKEIKWLTGAAMNREEVPRLQQEVPNAGMGIFDGDAPDQFEAKLSNKIVEVKLYTARLIMMLRNGIVPEKINAMGQNNMLPSEQQVRTAINAYGKELADQGLPIEEIRERLRKHFYTAEGD